MIRTRADFGSELEMPMALHRLNENGRQWLEALAADPVRCLPDHDQRLADRLFIEAPLRPCRRAPCRLSTAEHAHGVLAWKPVTAANSSRMRPFSARLPAPYRPTTA